jgi:hypothetical protein
MVMMNFDRSVRLFIVCVTENMILVHLEGGNIWCIWCGLCAHLK